MYWQIKCIIFKWTVDPAWIKQSCNTRMMSLVSRCYLVSVQKFEERNSVCINIFINVHLDSKWNHTWSIFTLIYIWANNETQTKQRSAKFHIALLTTLTLDTGRTRLALISSCRRWSSFLIITLSSTNSTLAWPWPSLALYPPTWP